MLIKLLYSVKDWMKDKLLSMMNLKINYFNILILIASFINRN